MGFAGGLFGGAGGADDKIGIDGSRRLGIRGRIGRILKLCFELRIGKEKGRGGKENASRVVMTIIILSMISQP